MSSASRFAAAVPMRCIYNRVGLDANARLARDPRHLLRAANTATIPRMRIAILAMLLMSLSRVAAAQSSEPPPPPAAYPPPPAGYPPPPPGWMPVAPVAFQLPPPPRRVFSLTISPIHLTFPIVELTGEIRAHDKLGLAMVAGVGRYTDKSVDISAAVYELGAQLRFYAIG